MPSYAAGKRAAPGGHKLSSNENPFDPLPSVLAVIQSAATQIHRYPDPAAGELVAALAHKYAVQPAEIVVGTGSVALCGQLVSIVAEAGDEVVFSWPSFEAYPIVCGIAGATAVPVPLNSAYATDMPATIAAVTPNTKVVFVCTPNNPTGTIVSHADVERLLAAVSPEVLVVIDEAYVEFVDDSAAVDALSLFRQYQNVVVLRTFSKAYGLAGLRVGYALAHPGIAAALRKTSIPFGVSTIAADAAVASLAAESELLARVETLCQRREQVCEALRAQGWQFPDPQGNFIWLPTGEKTMRMADFLAEEGIVVRPFPGVGMRITIAENSANMVLIAALSQLKSEVWD